MWLICLLSPDFYCIGSHMELEGSASIFQNNKYVLQKKYSAMTMTLALHHEQWNYNHRSSNTGEENEQKG